MDSLLALSGRSTVGSTGWCFRWRVCASLVFAAVTVIFVALARCIFTRIDRDFGTISQFVGTGYHYLFTWQ
jgi:hypothetical protein